MSGPREPRSAVKNAADPDQVEQARRREVDQRREDLKDMTALLATPIGRRIVWRILSQCGLFSDGWDPSARIHFNAGKRNVGLWLLDEVMAANDEAFLLMQREAKQKETQDA